MIFFSNSGNFHSNVYVLLVNLLGIVLGSVEIPRPRGVSLSRVGLYDPEQNFSCFDGTKTISFDQVNDDYCDCLDGSDEPGTSACPLGNFYCSNAGHRPQILPSDRVNDGVCDCCDGSDEYTGRFNCENNCLEVGRAAREEAARVAELFKHGKQLRTDLIQEGQKLKKEKEQKLNDLKKNIEEAEKIKAERESVKNQAEEAENKALEYYRELEEQYKTKKAALEAEKQKQEATEYFKKLDSNENGLIEVAELQSQQTFDRDRNGEVSEEEAKLFLGKEEAVNLETFIEKTWNLLKPFITREQGLYKPPSTETEGETEKEHEEQEQAEAESDEEEEEDDEETDEKEVAEEQEDRIEYDEETQKLVDIATDARNKFSESEKDIRDIKNQIKQIEDSMRKDFGHEEEFATLEGQCFEYHDHEYIYKLCPFDKTVQIPKSSSLETNLGKWSRWDGPTSNLYGTMLYDNGQNCWNGPNRSTKVRVSCGTENKVTNVAEPNRCEYAFDFETPAACRDPSEEGQKDVHDEL